jgi:hypothetical protein
MLGSIIFLSSIGANAAIVNSKRKAFRDKKFVVYTTDELPETIVVDGKHPSAYQLTHHLKGKVERNNMNLKFRADTSTESVINAIEGNDPHYNEAQFVSTNHFDIDSFLSVWCAMNSKLASKNRNLIVEAARIGDFRELR